MPRNLRVVYRPDKQQKARCSPKRDDEGTEHRQSQEIWKDFVTAVPAWTLAQRGCQVAWLGIRNCCTSTIVKHLTNRNQTG